MRRISFWDGIALIHALSFRCSLHNATIVQVTVRVLWGCNPTVAGVSSRQGLWQGVSGATAIRASGVGSKDCAAMRLQASWLQRRSPSDATSGGALVRSLTCAPGQPLRPLRKRRQNDCRRSTGAGILVHSITPAQRANGLEEHRPHRLGCSASLGGCSRLRGGGCELPLWRERSG